MLRLRGLVFVVAPALLLVGSFLTTPALAQAPTGAPLGGTILIARIWHGHTPAAKAVEYTKYLYEAGIKKIESIPGNRGVQMFRKIDGQYGDFTVISYWDSIDAIKRFAGEHYEQTHNLPKDSEYLIDMEPTVKHVEVLVNHWQK